MESLPLDPDLCRWSDSGTPAVLVMSESKIAQLYHALASAVVQEIAKRAFGNRSKVPQVVFDSDKVRFCKMGTQARQMSILYFLVCNCYLQHPSIGWQCNS
jgi:hypothetical protein